MVNSYINFKGSHYPVRGIHIGDELGLVLISTTQLNDLILDPNGNFTSDEARSIDESIFCYVSRTQLNYSDENLRNLIFREVL